MLPPVERLEGARVERAEVVVEGVDEGCKRNPALELRGAAAEHEQFTRVGTIAELLEQRGLADARLPRHGEHRPRIGRERVKRAVDRGQLGGPTEEPGWL